MREEIEVRVLSIARAMVKSGATVRVLAREYGVSKSTVHKDMSQRLKRLDPDLYDMVQAVLRRNKAERHIRGGRATSLKYQLRREKLLARKNRVCDASPRRAVSDRICAPTCVARDIYEIYAEGDDGDLPDENALFPR